MKHEKLMAIASKYPSKTPAQILLAWALQQGMGKKPRMSSIVIPYSELFLPMVEIFVYFVLKSIMKLRNWIKHFISHAMESSLQIKCAWKNSYVE